jgi:hypothetical protein
MRRVKVCRAAIRRRRRRRPYASSLAARFSHFRVDGATAVGLLAPRPHAAPNNLSLRKRLAAQLGCAFQKSPEWLMIHER